MLIDPNNFKSHISVETLSSELANVLSNYLILQGNSTQHCIHQSKLKNILSLPTENETKCSISSHTCRRIARPVQIKQTSLFQQQKIIEKHFKAKIKTVHIQQCKLFELNKSLRVDPLSDNFNDQLNCLPLKRSQSVALVTLTRNGYIKSTPSVNISAKKSNKNVSKSKKNRRSSEDKARKTTKKKKKKGGEGEKIKQLKEKHHALVEENSPFRTIDEIKDVNTIPLLTTEKPDLISANSDHRLVEESIKELKQVNAKERKKIYELVEKQNSIDNYEKKIIGPLSQTPQTEFPAYILEQKPHRKSLTMKTDQYHYKNKYSSIAFDNNSIVTGDDGDQHRNLSVSSQCLNQIQTVYRQKPKFRFDYVSINNFPNKLNVKEIFVANEGKNKKLKLKRDNIIYCPKTSQSKFRKCCGINHDLLMDAWKILEGFFTIKRHVPSDVINVSSIQRTLDDQKFPITKENIRKRYVKQYKNKYFKSFGLESLKGQLFDTINDLADYKRMIDTHIE
ncbi:unnamed protein product [Didymodactylos carnosus]|uniref:Uncharacterized protein n=1 Tax=Didymodactylos carnosus TaxID=1234261 RepID=A0A813ZX83_9BILA|nr:unnamed protein product [Didymodactylos carnosus]CAF0971755.1 unnamed protein product [Didymodactylos carnosus]CAF3687258.1 unnamed protein product [Didymodactylos carnosus]CAF3743118.1 unnamed protein product [Didymodactylos carnosus]